MRPSDGSRTPLRAQLLGNHGTSRASEELGGGEPSLIPAPRLQQAPVSPRHAPLLLSSVFTFSSSICTPQPSAPSSLTQKRAERGLWSSWRLQGGCSGSTTFICSSFESTVETASLSPEVGWVNGGQGRCRWQVAALPPRAEKQLSLHPPATRRSLGRVVFHAPELQ